MKKVSICIPAYEQPDNLDKCLNSILNQTFTDYEVIVTDDSLSNDLISVVNKYSDKIDIQYFKNPTSLGSPENWNKAISLAKGKYIKILHHDDSFNNNHSLQKFIDLMEGGRDISVVFCSSSHVDGNGQYLSSHIINKKIMKGVRNNPKTLIFGNVIGAPSVMMYKSDLNLKFDRRLKWLVDVDFYIRLLQISNFCHTEERLIKINIGEEERVTVSCMHDRSINIYEAMVIYEKIDMDRLNFPYGIFFIKLFIRFNIKSVRDINNCGYGGILCNQFNSVFKYVVLLSPIYKTIRTVKNYFRYGNC